MGRESLSDKLADKERRRKVRAWADDPYEIGHATADTGNPVCPWCGHEERDAWEIDFGTGENAEGIDCGSCGREFDIHRYTPPPKYTTSRPDDPDGSGSVASVKPGA